MTLKIELADEIGFCFGVRRAINILENKVKEFGKIESLGAVVHNEEVMQDLAEKGIRVINSIEEIQSKVVAISAHGVSPVIEDELKKRKIEVIDTTCPFVKRAQIAAKRLSEAGFWVVVYGDSQHTEVRGILGRTNGQGTSTLNSNDLKSESINKRRLGVLSQTTQIPERYTKFVKDIMDFSLVKDAEIRILDTICHDIRKRQAVSLDLANKVDLMLVIGGNASSNTRRLFELCSEKTETHLIGTFRDIDLSWLDQKDRIGVTSGTSTSMKTIDEVANYLDSRKIK